MESPDGFLPMSPFTFLHDSKSSPVDSGGNPRTTEGVSHHQRCSSESFLLEEQPSWLDDLLNDQETGFHRGHRRSASDSYAYLAVDTLNMGNESEFIYSYFGPSTSSHNYKKTKDVEEGVSSLGVENSRQDLEGSADKAVGSQVKNTGSKPESKRSKQHNTHRSRLRKLQYTAHLERTVEILKAEGSAVSAELEFMEQQNVILTMENRALRQRLESISQEQIIKNWEQGMLEREIARLQSLYHLQKHQQMQMHHHQQQHNQHSKHRRNRSRDLDHQVHNASMKNKDAISTKNSVDAPIHVN